CLKTHPRCKAKGADYAPTRLLHVNKDGQLQLRFQTDIPTGARYVALSHRWGEKRDSCCVTTRTNIEERKNNIPWDELPKVFDDAIKLAIGLGVSYIWIDSLCIVQDDAEDWEREATNMVRIFSNALVTIAALRSRAPQESMFDHDAVFQQNEADESLLLCRAWAFQDCLVSARIAHIGTQEIAFECRERRVCEDDDWHDMVEQFSMLKLSNEKDRLIALGGYAQQYAQAHPGQQYLAGSWSGNLSHHLLWTRHAPTPSVPGVSVCIAPSWSWAS
ncbi:heterokaryon incompatibility protein-domain-containing protein, partial [Microdochium bolleyi]